MVTTKGRAFPALQRIDPSGRLVNLLPLPTLPLPASVSLTSLASTANGDMVLCARKRESFDLHVLRLHVDATSAANLRWQAATRVPGPTTTGDIISGGQRPVTVYPVTCQLAADGSVLMYYQKSGGINNTLVLHRFLADGTPDASFGTAGMMQSSGAFPLGQMIQFGGISLVWVSADGAINVVSEGALVRQALGALIERESARRLAQLGGSEAELRPVSRRQTTSE